MEKGLSAGDRKYVMLSDNSQLAYRIAKRRDQKPVMLEVTAAAAEKEGISFYPFGQLFLAHHIPVSFISGPPVSPETSLTGPASKRQREVPAREGWKGADPGAGTFVLDLNRDPDPYRRDKANKKRGWKEEARKMRRRDSR
jgi:putative RNA 2'-phosphotransferase